MSATVKELKEETEKELTADGGNASEGFKDTAHGESEADLVPKASGESEKIAGKPESSEEDEADQPEYKDIEEFSELLCAELSKEEERVASEEIEAEDSLSETRKQNHEDEGKSEAAETSNERGETEASAQNETANSNTSTKTKEKHMKDDSNETLKKTGSLDKAKNADSSGGIEKTELAESGEKGNISPASRSVPKASPLEKTEPKTSGRERAAGISDPSIFSANKILGQIFSRVLSGENEGAVVIESQMRHLSIGNTLYSEADFEEFMSAKVDFIARGKKDMKEMFKNISEMYGVLAFRTEEKDKLVIRGTLKSGEKKEYTLDIPYLDCKVERPFNEEELEDLTPEMEVVLSKFKGVRKTKPVRIRTRKTKCHLILGTSEDETPKDLKNAIVVTKNQYSGEDYSLYAHFFGHNGEMVYSVNSFLTAKNDEEKRLLEEVRTLCDSKGDISPEKKDEIARGLKPMMGINHHISIEAYEKSKGYVNKLDVYGGSDCELAVGRELTLEVEHFFKNKVKSFYGQVKKDKDGQLWFTTREDFYMKNTSKLSTLKTAEKIFEPGKGDRRAKSIIAVELTDRHFLEGRIDENLNKGRGYKILVYKDLTPIYIKREYYFIDDNEKVYVKKFPRYIRKRFGQSKEAAKYDYKIIQMLAERDWEHILSINKDSLATMLRLIAYAPKKLIDGLLGNLENLDTDAIKKSIKEYKEQNPPNGKEYNGQNPPNSKEHKEQNPSNGDNEETKLQKRKTDLIKTVGELGLSIDETNFEALLSLKKCLSGLKKEALKEILIVEEEESSDENKEISEDAAKESSDDQTNSPDADDEDSSKSNDSPVTDGDQSPGHENDDEAA